MPTRRFTDALSNHAEISFAPNVGRHGAFRLIIRSVSGVITRSTYHANYASARIALGKSGGPWKELEA